MLTLCLTLLLSSVVTNVTLTDGQQLRGELQQIDGTKALVLVDGKKRDFEISGIETLTFETALETVPMPLVVELNDGSVVRANEVSSSESKTIITIQGEHPSTIKGPTNGVRAVRYFANGSERLEQWQEIVNKDGQEDLLVVSRGGNLDYLAGVILGFNANTIQFRFGGNDRSIPLEKAAGFVFAKTQTPSKPARIRLATHAGDSWQLAELASNGKAFVITSSSGFRSELAVSTVKELQFKRTGIVYLSAIEPESSDYVPFLESIVAAKDLKTLNLPRVDEDFAGQPLRIQNGKKKTAFKRGLAMASKSEITYRLAGKYTSFQAWAGMAPDAPPLADVQLRVFTDDQEVLTKNISKSNQPVLVDVPLTKANRLKIMVDYGKNMDIGDRLHLGDARLTK